MGLDNIPTRSTGQTILEDFYNVLKRVLGGDFVPRNVSGNPQGDLGHLGSEDYPWKRAHITTGYFECGDIVAHHSFNGTVYKGQGWMKMNGNVVNEANYDAIHGAGSWDEYIATSPLEGKYLPNMSDRYLVGKSSTTQNGSVAITPVGISGSVLNLNHSHDMTHRHRWIVKDGVAGAGSTMSWNAAGALRSLWSDAIASIEGLMVGQDVVSGALVTPNTSYTETHAGSTGTGLSTTQSIQPDSIEVEYWIRII